MKTKDWCQTEMLDTEQFNHLIECKQMTDVFTELLGFNSNTWKY